MTAAIVGIDVGTTACKGLLLGLDGAVLAEASAAQPQFAPQPGWAEADAAAWWANACAVARELLARAPGVEVRGVGVAGMLPALLLLDAEEEPLRRSIQQNDARTGTEIEAMRAATDEAAFLARTGSPISQQSIGPRVRWLRTHEPGTMARVARICGSYDYVTYKLTGALGVERNWALESGLYDLGTADWADDLLALGQVERDWLPPLRWPTEVVGAVTPGAAEVSGIPAGTPVCTGSADHIASALATGCVEEGDLLLKIGGSADILYTTARGEPHPQLFLDYHDVPGRFVINGCMASGGALLHWFVEQFCRDVPGPNRYATLDAEAAAVPPGCEGLTVLPYVQGEKTPIFDPAARGVLSGFTLAHTRAHVYRAILEAFAFGFRHHLDVLREAGHEPRRALISDGGARSALWRQIVADVLGLAVTWCDHPSGRGAGGGAGGGGIGRGVDWGDGAADSAAARYGGVVDGATAARVCAGVLGVPGVVSGVEGVFRVTSNE
ncbi:MAG: FGGY family carbohydrate kinase [Thermomicrobiales bacterium]